jgi:tetratricopeptide (TPR) repeat protein
MVRSICSELSKGRIAIYEQKRKRIACIVCLLWLALLPSSTVFAQNEDSEDKVIKCYKQMLERKPKAGSTFDRLYQFYLEGAGLDAMAADYQTAALANPNNPNLQLILGHIYKRLGKDNETVAAYQRAVELAPNNYYPHFALGQAYATLRRYEDAIAALT